MVVVLASIIPTGAITREGIGRLCFNAEHETKIEPLRNSMGVFSINSTAVFEHLLAFHKCRIIQE